MTAVLNVKSNYVGSLDAAIATGYAGVPQLTAGEGAPDRVVEQCDWTALTTAFLGAAGNYARLIRVPANAVLKKFEVFADAILDTDATTGALQLDFGVAFSDAYSARGKCDGTSPSYDSLVPTSSLNGTTTTFASWTTPNLLFGSIVQATSPGKNKIIPVTEMTFNGANATYPWTQIISQPLASIFGFTDQNGNVREDMGYMDIFAYVHTAATTAQAGNLFARVQYANRG